ncbi:uncharacterized protein [Dermacentor andersoni]|uniref:uncharacterized protein isoform X1 n=2 Tax=Dermacentor andersoni TaxID=34620 RepID=UPI002155BAA0|nr:uncharacterized protein LOC126542988 isoform X1 [Dermacentor andersoni]
MSSLFERVLNFLQRRLPCVMAVQEQDADVTGFYVRLSGDLEPEPPEQTSSGSTRNAAVPAARTALAPAKPPRLRTVKPVPTAFPSNWSSRRGRPDYALSEPKFLPTDRGPRKSAPYTKAASAMQSSQLLAEAPVQRRRLLKPSSARPPTPFVELQPAVPSQFQHRALSPGLRYEWRV